jgi:hypothetical protein
VENPPFVDNFPWQTMGFDGFWISVSIEIILWWRVHESHREMIQYISQTQKLVYDAGGIQT